MEIAITGASGLIGTALTEKLTADGHRVVPVSRSAGDGIHWDPANGTVDSAGLEGLDAVVHLAGEPIGDKRWNDEVKRRIHDSRTDSTRLLATTLASLDKPPRVLLSGSAIGYYGDAGATPLTETSPPGNDFLAKVCVDWESATEPAEAAGIRVARLRTGLVLTPDGGALAKMLPLFKLGLGGKMGSGRQYWSAISIDDEVGIITWLLHNEVSGPVNLTCPEPTTNAEFTDTLGDVLGRPTIVPVPAFGPKLLLGGELADALLFTSARVIPQVAETAGYVFQHPTLESALRAVLD